MKFLPWRWQIGFVAASFATALGLSGMLVLQRYLLYVNHPEDVAAAGGMYAAGDMMLEVFIGLLLLAPAILLALVIRHSEKLYNRYAQVAVGVSLTAPISFGLLSLPAVSQSSGMLGELLMFRMVITPLVLLALLLSRWLARFQPAKRLTMYAVVIEALTIVAAVSLMVYSAGSHQN
jgi:hypothetical protein